MLVFLIVSDCNTSCAPSFFSPSLFFFFFHFMFFFFFVGDVDDWSYISIVRDVLILNVFLVLALGLYLIYFLV